jgi:crotonobetainyl-CoA:carnitine CoA-transferase CaiB-like acyl-CoA transferase
MSDADAIELGRECYRRGHDRGVIDACAAELVAAVAEDEAARLLRAAGIPLAKARTLADAALADAAIEHPDARETTRRTLAAMRVSTAVRAWFARQLLQSRKCGKAA